jgi:hypothetical protein
VLVGSLVALGTDYRDRWRRHDIAAYSANVDTAGDLTGGVRDHFVWHLVKQVLAKTTSDGLVSLREVVCLGPRKTVRINVNDEKVLAGSESDVGVWKRRPPLLDLLLVKGSVLATVF